MVIGRRNNASGGRLIFALIVAAVSLFSYCSLSQTNPVTGEKQHIGISPEQEVALGLQAAPEMAQEFGGLDPSEHDQQIVKNIGQKIISGSIAAKAPYEFDFHLLADDHTVNAFALPGGQIFITRALFDKLKTPGEVAGVLGHEAGHVVGRHSAEQMAKVQLTQGITGAAVIASTDPNDPSSYRNAAVAQMIGQLINLKYSRSNESEADMLGVRLMAESGFDPRSMIQVMEVLKQSGGAGGPEFFKTHPNPANREAAIKEAIAKQFPNGVPPRLTQ